MSFAGINAEQNIYAGPFRMGGSGAGFTGPANTVFLVPFAIHVNSSFTSIQVTVQLATGNHELAVYDDNFNRLATSGVFSQNSNLATIAVRLLPGRYWLAYIVTAAGSQVYGGANSGLIVKKQVAVGTPLPAILTPIDAIGADNVPRIMIYQ